MRFQQLAVSVALAAALALTANSVAPDVALAQAEPEQVDPDFKGILGLGLFGAELGFVIPALAGATDTWPYIVFPLLGAAGGGVAGYFLLEEPGHTEVSVAAFGIGLALVVPAVVITLSATAYDPDSDEEALESEDSGSEEAPAEEEAAPAEEARARTRRVALGGLVTVGDDAVSLSIPLVSVSQAYTQAELARYGGSQRLELHVPVVSGVF